VPCCREQQLKCRLGLRLTKPMSWKAMLLSLLMSLLLLLFYVHVWCRKSGACVDELKLVAQKLRRLPVVDPALPVVSCNPAACLMLFDLIACVRLSTSLTACAPVCLSVCLSGRVSL